MSAKHGFVMMIQSKWWRRFCDRNQKGEKVHSYVQKGLAPPKAASVILFYVAKPVGQMAGHAEFIERQAGEKAEVWDKYGAESVLKSKKRYEEFLGGKEKASFIRFRNLREAANPVPLKDILTLLDMRRLSRKGFYLDRDTTERFLTLMES